MLTADDEEYAKMLGLINSKSPHAKSNLEMISHVHQCAQGIWYYNSGQLCRMMIKTKTIKLIITATNDLREKVNKVLYPFELQLQSKHINVYLLIRKSTSVNISTDWKRFEIILFNIIQNAVKYNRIEGDILIMLSVSAKNENDLRKLKAGFLKDYVLNVEVIDTGCGING